MAGSPPIKRFLDKPVGVTVDELSDKAKKIDERPGADGDGYVEHHEWQAAVDAGEDVPPWETIVGKGKAAENRTIELKRAQNSKAWNSFGDLVEPIPPFWNRFVRPTFNTVSLSLTPKSLAKATIPDLKIPRVIKRSLRVGRGLVVLDGVVAAGMTAWTASGRGEDLSDKSVKANYVSNGIYEGTTAFASAKAGAIAFVATAKYFLALPIPGGRPVAVVAGLAAALVVGVGGKAAVDCFKGKMARFGYKLWDKIAG